MVRVLVRCPPTRHGAGRMQDARFNQPPLVEFPARTTGLGRHWLGRLQVAPAGAPYWQHPDPACRLTRYGDGVGLSSELAHRRLQRRGPISVLPETPPIDGHGITGTRGPVGGGTLVSPCNSERARAMQGERRTRALELRVTLVSVLCERAAQPCEWARALDALQEPRSSEPMQHLLRRLRGRGCAFSRCRAWR